MKLLAPIVAASLAASIPALPEVMESPDEVMMDIFPVSMLVAIMPKFDVPVRLAPAAILIAMSPAPPPCALAEMPLCAPETAPESLTVMSPFP